MSEAGGDTIRCFCRYRAVIIVAQAALGAHFSDLCDTAIYADASGYKECVLAARFWQAMQPAL